MRKTLLIVTCASIKAKHNPGSSQMGKSVHFINTKKDMKLELLGFSDVF
jgi:hypothetical protein